MDQCKANNQATRHYKQPKKNDSIFMFSKEVRPKDQQWNNKPKFCQNRFKRNQGVRTGN
jgi:hypothetical protein